MSRADHVGNEKQVMLQSLIEQLPVAVHVKDLQGHYLLVNRRFEAL